MLNGLTASMLLTAFEPVERALLGRVQLYAPEAMLSSLFHARFPGVQPIRLRTGALVLRSLYGASIGALYAAARRRLPFSGLGRTALVAGAIWAFELGVLPASGATPPLRKWPKAEIALLLLHTFVFASALRALSERGR
jgi:hypothetical protein